MNDKRTIGIVTGTRADYGLLHGLMTLIREDPELELRLFVTGMHLSHEFGLTYEQIIADGFKIDAKIESQLSSDTAVGVSKSLGLGVIGFADAFDRIRPDLLIVMGDRFEMLAAVQAAMVAGIPMAHIAGGDTTEGAFDEAIRHSLTKMSHLHFVTNEQAAERVRQLGENPSYVYNFGSPGIDYIHNTVLLNKAELSESISFTFRERNLLITFHPVTLDTQSSQAQFEQLLLALDRLGSNIGLIFTKPNADNDGRAIGRLIDEFVSNRDNAAAYTSLGQLRYLSAMSMVSAVVGNSSSGLYEAPTLKVPTVNIGDRQKGRIQANSVIQCNPEEDSIYNAITLAFEWDCNNTVNPYGEGRSSERILQALKEIPDYSQLLKKTFHKAGNRDDEAE